MVAFFGSSLIAGTSSNRAIELTPTQRKPILEAALSGVLDVRRGHAITIAVRGVAEKRPALHDLGLAIRRAGGIAQRRRVELRGEPVRAPLPHVAGHGVEAEGVGRKAVHRARAGEAILGGVDARKFSLPDVAHVFAGRGELVAPRVELLLEASARGVLPLRLGGQRPARPGGVGRRVVPGDVHHRMARPVVHMRAGPLGMAPIRAGHLAPPGGGGDRVLDQFVEPSGREVHPEDERPLIDLGLGAVARLGDEGGEVGICNRECIDCEGREGHGAHRPLAVGGEGVLVAGAHQELAAGQRDGGAGRCGRAWAAPERNRGRAFSRPMTGGGRAWALGVHRR